MHKVVAAGAYLSLCYKPCGATCMIQIIASICRALYLASSPCLSRWSPACLSACLGFSACLLYLSGFLYLSTCLVVCLPGSLYLSTCLVLSACVPVWFSLLVCLPGSLYLSECVQSDRAVFGSSSCPEPDRAALEELGAGPEGATQMNMRVKMSGCWAERQHTKQRSRDVDEEPSTSIG